MEQIKRCDIHPQGWFSSAGGPNPDAPSTWSCTNTTISRIGEIPTNCQYSTFWAFPDDMKYRGPAVLNGVECDQWTYFSQADEYTLYAIMLDEVTGESEPVVSASVVDFLSFTWHICLNFWAPGTDMNPLLLCCSGQWQDLECVQCLSMDAVLSWLHCWPASWLCIYSSRRLHVSRLHPSVNHYLRWRSWTTLFVK